MTDSSKEAAQAQLIVLQADLDSAERDLSVWCERDLNRGEGSEPQNKRHEIEGNSLQSRLYEAGKKVEAQEKLIVELDN